MPTISIVLPNLGGGGAERLHVNLARQWISQGYSVEFVLLQATGELMPILPAGVSVVHLNVFRNSEAIIPLARYLRKHRPSVTLTAMWSLTSAAAIAWTLASRPGRLFLSDHEHLTQSYIHRKRVSPFFIKCLIRYTYPLAAGVIAVSLGVLEDLQTLGSLSRASLKVIYNPAATSIPSSRLSFEDQQGLWGRGFDYHILSVGRLSEEKDHHMLLRAFALIPHTLKAKLVILGDGPLRYDLIDLAKSLGLQDRVLVPGFMRDTSPWYRSADLFVLSSRWEGFGNVIVEALECGVPVVSTDCPSGPTEILEGGRYGKLVPVGDAATLAGAMLTSLNESHDIEALMRRARDFSVEKIAKEYLDYFRLRGAKICAME